MSGALARILSEWRRLTLKETAALRAHDWGTVASCQESKAALRPQIEGGSTPPELRPVIEELTAWESENQAWLKHQLIETRQQRNELANSTRNLARLRQSYAGRHSAHWESYS